MTFGETRFTQRSERGGPATLPRITVPVHRLTRYLRAHLEVADGVLRWVVPRTLLGVIPIGERHIEAPLEDVRSIRIRRVARPVNLTVGTAFIAVPLVLGWWWAVGPLTVLGLWVVVVSLGPRLELLTHSGANDAADVCPGHEIDAELYIAGVNDLIGASSRSSP